MNTKLRRTLIAAIIFVSVLFLAFHLRQAGPRWAGLYALIHQRGGLQYVVLLLSAFGVAACVTPLRYRSDMLSMRHPTVVCYALAGLVSLISSFTGYMTMIKSPLFATWTREEKFNVSLVVLDPIFLWVLLLMALLVLIGARKTLETFLRFSKSRHERH